MEQFVLTLVPEFSCPKLRLLLETGGKEKYGGNSNGLEGWGQGGKNFMGEKSPLGHRLKKGK